MKKTLKKIINQLGYDILHLPTNQLDRNYLELLNKYKIDLIFDIGANEGQYASKIRKYGYKGKIISFEPLPDAFEILSIKSNLDHHWIPVNLALGNQDGTLLMHKSQNSYSSSLLSILPRHIESAPDSICSEEIFVTVTSVDKILPFYFHHKQNLFIKIDTQGYEHEVLVGCEKSLSYILGFQMELSFQPLYSGETLIFEMIDILRLKGYNLMHLEPGHIDYSSGELLQVDCTFFKQS